MVKISSVSEYVEGTNMLLDRINNGKTVWIVQGSKGRRPIIANSEDEARKKYLQIAAPVIEDAEEATV